MLMELSVGIEMQNGVKRAMALMATKPNLDLLEELGLLAPKQAKVPQDGVLLAIDADTEDAAQEALKVTQTLLQSKRDLARPGGSYASIHTTETHSIPTFASWREVPETASVALISVPGEYAVAETWKALKAGRHVVLFSNQVSIDDEYHLKQAAQKRGLLMLGAECGTAILGDMPLGFANLARRGSIGIVAASGSGLQEVICLLDRWGGGITHAIGVGGRDLSAKVRGSAMHAGLNLLVDDLDTHVIVLLSKPPDPKIAESILASAQSSGKPVVVCFLGLTTDLQAGENVFQARTLEEAACLAMRLAELPEPTIENQVPQSMPTDGTGATQYVRGLFSGGTLAYEAMLILTASLGPVYSNTPLDPAYKLEKGQTVAAHTVLDLGTEEYTTGVPHPMIDGRFRSELIADAGSDPLTRVILLDVLLGLGSDANPVASIAPGIRRALDAAASAGRNLFIIASVTGTQKDPQCYEKQVKNLTDLGVEVYQSNAAAAQQAARVIIDPGDHPSGGKIDGCDQIAENEATTGQPYPKNEPFSKENIIVNVGLRKFATDLHSAGFLVVDKGWRPPHQGDPAIGRFLANLADDTQGLGLKISLANKTAFEQLVSSQPVLRGLAPAGEILSGMTRRTILHAGPPVSWEKMCQAMRGAVIGGLIYEGLAETPEQAEMVASSGEIEFAPCHSRNAVGPMAGIITASMPVLIVENTTSGTTAYATMNEGWGRTLRFGAFDEGVIRRLVWMRDELAPILNRALAARGGIDVKAIISRALHMGDECHNRDLAATTLFYKEINPWLVRTAGDLTVLDRVLEFLSQNEHFFLNIAMAGSKAGLLAAEGVPFSSMVTAIARNGVEVGIRVSGAGDHWFTANATVPHGLYFAGYSEADANPDLGDSAITETGGIGAFAMAGAPAIVRFVGGSPADALAYTEEMYHITLGENFHYTLPPLNFRGTPTGIDVRLVMETAIAPVINTGIAHKEAGHGLVGAGVVRAPMDVFAQALRWMHEEWCS